ncbi:MAG: hypothetical protein JWM95_3927 [Gemmatimonadetes bacterium]|nr:hypothetical protein [Gemmatimonadota bacterium]
MREAKILFDAEMAKNSMKGRGRPSAAAKAAQAAAGKDEEHDDEGSEK